MRLGRRPLFFFGCAAACLALYFPTPAEFRLVNLATAGLGAFWAIALSIEEIANRRASSAVSSLAQTRRA